MEDLRTIYRLLLGSDGIGQAERMNAALEEGYFQLDDRGIAAQITSLYSLSKELNFYDSYGNKIGDWQKAFDQFVDSNLPPALLNEEEILNVVSQLRNAPPSLALLLTFLKLLESSRAGINHLTRRHLNYYYKAFLKFGLLKGAADRVHVLFELNRNAADQLIPEGTLLDAGVGKDGKLLQYKTSSDLIVNQAKLSAIKTVFVEKFDTELSRIIWSQEYDPLLLPERLFPFGQPQFKIPASERTMNYAVTGMALASSLFYLEGGERHILVTLFSEAYSGTVPSYIDLESLVKVELTGEKGWISPQVQKVVIEKDLLNPSNAKMSIELYLNEAIPGIYGHREAIHKGGFPAEDPVLRIVSKVGAKLPEELYSFRIAESEIHVKVNGLKKAVVQNDESLLTVKSPFQLFGANPVIGSHFYIGSNECFHKNLRQLTINVKWKNPPVDFKKYYAGYPVPPWFSHAEFKMDVDILLDGNMDGHSLVTEYSLFDAGKKDFPLTLTFSNDDLKKANNGQELQREMELPDLTSGYFSGVKRGFLRFTLNGPVYEKFTAFGHSNYAQALSSTMQAMINNPGIVIDMPEVPYTPQVKEISIDYVADDKVFGSGNDRIFHITPFGINSIVGKGAAVFPEFKELGYLFLGLSDLLPSQQVDLLFNLSENGNDEFDGYAPDYSTPIIKWAYLSGDTWVELRKDQIPVNTTSDLQQSGILAIQSGANATRTHTSMPKGLLWLRAALTKGINRVLPVNGIHTQAVEAVLELLPDLQLEDYSAHLLTGIAPDTIKKNISIAPSLKSIKQPYGSFGGLQPETDDHFIKRLAERVRHRNRAVTSWDFERLTLEAFPNIIKCKSLSGGETELPGTVLTIVIPKLRQEAPLEKRLKPKASTFILDQVRQYLTDHTSFFTKVVVDNPVYEELLTDFKVKFKVGYDPVYYLSRLNEAIIRFLSPWAFEEKASIHFDSEIYRSEIIYFIEKLPYVDYVADFKLFQLNARREPSKLVIGKMKIGKTFIVHKPLIPNIGGMTVSENFIVGIDWEVVTASQPNAVLVSVPQHTISILDEERVCSGISALGIGSMVIKLDFIVSKS